MTPAAIDAVGAIVGYLLGSIPFGLILTRFGGTQDLRSIGSGSIGATNVLRTGRKGLAAATLAGDLLKGTLAVIIGAQLGGTDLGLIAGAAAFFGHLFPVWLRFKGGKGIATAFGVLLVVSWKAALLVALIWLAVAIASRYSSLASLTAAVAAPILLWFLSTPFAASVFLVLAIATFFMHRKNVARLANGTEGKIGAKT